MPRLLGVDLGTVRIGLALSDPLGIAAHPQDVIPNDDVAQQVIADLATKMEVRLIVVGAPIRLDGTRGPEVERAEEFAKQLATAAGVPVELWDERLSSVEAERAMRTGGTSARGQRGVLDKVAAAIVLQSYLEAHR